MGRSCSGESDCSTGRRHGSVVGNKNGSAPGTALAVQTMIVTTSREYRCNVVAQGVNLRWRRGG